MTATSTMSSSRTKSLEGEFLVRGGATSTSTSTGSSSSPLLISDVSLSFWGGIDPISGIVVDTSHPLCGQCVSGTILCLPSGRGSCTASQVLLELILNKKSPKAFVFRDVDGLACVGAIVAKEVFASSSTSGGNNNSSSSNGISSDIEVPDMIHIGTHSYEQLLSLASSSSSETAEVGSQQHRHHGCVLPNGDLIIGDSAGSVQNELDQWKGGEDNNRDNSNIDVTQQQFTETEQAMIDECTTEAERMAYRVLFQYAHLGNSTDNNNNNDKPPPVTYYDITQVHVDGCTYIGPGGLQFTQRLVQANGKVKVPTTLNSVSADRRLHQQLGVPSDYAANSIALGDAYLALGCQPSFTCAPYLLTTTNNTNSSTNNNNGGGSSGGDCGGFGFGGIPKLGDQIAWGESNAVVYANSVLGARTEKYADYLDICCALTGKVAATGVHLNENRKPQIVLDATDMLQELANHYFHQGTSSITTLEDSNNNNSIINLEMLFPTLGHVCGSLSDGKVPVLVGFNKEEWVSIITKDHLKAFCAAFGTTGTSPLVHIDGITPETKQDPSLTQTALNSSCPTKLITWDHCQETFDSLNNNNNNNNDTANNEAPKIDLVALGNPHLSVQECSNLVSIIKQMSASSSSSNEEDDPVVPKKHPNVRIMACLSREIHSQAEELGYIQYLKDFGIEFINDTCWCMLLDPPVIPPDPNATILTNSGKYAHYGPGLTDRKFRYGSTEDCIYVAMTGEYPSPPQATAAAATPTTTTTVVPQGIPSWLLATTSIRPAFQHQQRNYSTAAAATAENHYYPQFGNWGTNVPAIMIPPRRSQMALLESQGRHHQSKTLLFGRSTLRFALSYLKK